MKQARILLAMSGGVDSTVAAALLLEAGYECAGITMKLQRDDLACIEGAKEACAALGIPHFVIDAREEFRIKVIEPFVRAYAAGQTPNPCIACNQHLKFTLLLNRAAEEGYDYLATGHYARIEEGRLLKAVDARKDQSYVLWPIRAQHLRRILFPLGGMTKAEARAIAAGLGLP
ncbi:MAG: 7-cyano-7-deazaguanine synthase, partial [Coriobacteriales bacterium]|nr:7-cyano-7-deazaguanine synthase [Coriobacteriales bacterium]